MIDRVLAGQPKVLPTERLNPASHPSDMPDQAYIDDQADQYYVHFTGRIGRSRCTCDPEDHIMAVNGRVQILNEVTAHPKGDWRLCFQRVRYIYDDGLLQEGYRFIWRRPDNSLQGARGQARIPSLKMARDLMSKADAEGWGHYDAGDGDLFEEPKAA